GDGRERLPGRLEVARRGADLGGGEAHLLRARVLVARLLDRGARRLRAAGGEAGERIGRRERGVVAVFLERLLEGARGAVEVLLREEVADALRRRAHVGGLAAADRDGRDHVPVDEEVEAARERGEDDEAVDP